MYKKLFVFIIVYLAQGFLFGQTFRTLEIDSANLTKSVYVLHRHVDRNINTVLLESNEEKTFFKLDVKAGFITQIVLDSNILPISFISDNMLLVRLRNSKKMRCYDMANNTMTETNLFFDKILTSLVSDAHFLLNSSLNECYCWNDSSVVRLSINNEDRMSDTQIFKSTSGKPITNVSILCDNIVVINFWDIEAMCEKSLVYNAINGDTINCGNILVYDCLCNNCIIWDGKGRAIAVYDVKKKTFKNIAYIKENIGALFGTFGFMTKDIVGWLSASEGDHFSFAPILNRKKMLKIEE